MPRFLLELEAPGRSARDCAIRLAAQRFPEIDLEQRYSTYDDDGERELWVCRAPNPAHVHRWLEAAALRPLAIRHVDGQSDLNGVPGELRRR